MWRIGNGSFSLFIACLKQMTLRCQEALRAFRGGVYSLCLCLHGYDARTAIIDSWNMKSLSTQVICVSPQKKENENAFFQRQTTSHFSISLQSTCFL